MCVSDTLSLTRDQLGDTRHHDFMPNQRQQRQNYTRVLIVVALFAWEPISARDTQPVVTAAEPLINGSDSFPRYTSSLPGSLVLPESRRL